MQSLNKRLSGVSDVVNGEGTFVCEPIPVDLTKECLVTLTGFKDELVWWENEKVYGHSKIRLCNANKIGLATWYFTKPEYDTSYQKLAITEDGDDYTFDVRDLLEKEGSIGSTTPTASEVQYVQFCFNISSTTITEERTTGFEILM